MVLAALYVYDREEHKPPTIDYSFIFRDIYHVLSMPQLWIIGLVGCFMFTPMQIFVSWAKTFFTQNYHVNDAVAGQITSMLFCGMVIGAPVSGWVASQIHNKKILLMAGSLFSSLCMSALLLQTWSITTASLLMFAIGCFVGIQQLIFVYAKELVRPHLIATSIASANMIVNLSSYIQPYVGGMLVLSPGSNHYTFSSWQFALSIIPLSLILSFILVFFIQSKEDT